uniref:Uncharacterized protein LOC105045087 isoform X3 n=1 Tax=Elaeis guineensis var. tenera TaxID=51953 RepID=A0A8N4F4S7_ELAGV|nr:uncharacterized protein LOC105045087 isoform X3 [Elaeis guineensis]
MYLCQGFNTRHLFKLQIPPTWIQLPLLELMGSWILWKRAWLVGVTLHTFLYLVMIRESIIEVVGHLSQWVLDWPCHQETLLSSRRADRHFEEEGPILCAALDGMKLPSFPEYEVRVKCATEHRCGVVVKGPKLSGNISGTDPLKDNRLLLKPEALDDTEEAKNTAAVVNELSKEFSRILVSHPLNAKRAAEGKNIANVVLLRGCGIRIEAIDDAGHDKASILKVRALEVIDLAIGQLARLLWETEKSGNFQYYLCVTGDHSTPVEYGDHSFEPVPFALCQSNDFVSIVEEANVLRTPLEIFPLPSVKAGEDFMEMEEIEMLDNRSEGRQDFSGYLVSEFSEIAAARGCLGRFPGSEMMGVIKEFLKLKNG